MQITPHIYRMKGSVIFRAGSLSYQDAYPLMLKVEQLAPTAARFVLSHRQYPRSIGWTNITNAEWWIGRDYIALVDKFLALIPPTDTIEDRMRAIIATQNTLERHLNFTRGFTHEFIIAEEMPEIIAVALPLTKVTIVR